MTLAIVSRCLGADHVTDGLRAALEERAVVEQAKGAIAVVRSVDMASAYDALPAFVESEGTSLGLIARRVMREAREGTLTDMVRGT